MLDKPEKTRQLILALEAAVPFKVALAPSMVAHLRNEPSGREVAPIQSVLRVSYLGDEGGIFCHVVPGDGQPPLALSLTHLHVPRKLPFAAAVLDYQKHRVKKLKKQYGSEWSAIQSDHT